MVGEDSGGGGYLSRLFVCVCVSDRKKKENVKSLISLKSALIHSLLKNDLMQVVV